MPSQQQPEGNLNGPAFAELATPAREHSTTAEEQLADAKLEIARLRKIAFGSAKVTDVVSYDVIRGEEIQVSLDRKNYVPLKNFLEDLISSGRTFELAIIAGSQSRGGDYRAARRYEFQNVTEGSITEIDAAFRSNRWGAGYNKLESPAIKIVYRE